MYYINNGLDNSVYAYMGWDKITNTGTKQYRLRENYRKTRKNLYDSNGLADIFGRKVIACTNKFGNVGEEIEITFQNPVPYWHQKGTLFAIIGDIKNQNKGACNEWGHLYGNQCCVIEFIVNPSMINNIKGRFPLLKNNPVVTIQKSGVNFFNKIDEYLMENHLI